MAGEVKGMGVCLIPNEQDIPCGRQIEEGEPISTVILNRTPIVGHRACAHGYHQRTQAAEREKRVQSMKIGKQESPGGSIGDPDKYPDALLGGSIPLVPEDKNDTKETLVESTTRIGGSVPPPAGVSEPSPVDPTALAEVEREVSWDRQMRMLTDEEKEALDKVREEFANRRAQITDAPREVVLDLTSDIPADVDLVHLVIDLRKLRP